MRDAVQRRVLFFEKAGDTCGDFVFVSQYKIVAVIQHFLRRALGKSYLAFYGDQHRGGTPTDGIKQQRNGLQTYDLAGQDRVAIGGSRDNFVRRAGKKFVNGSGGEALLDPVAGGLILQGWNGDDVNAFGEGITATGNMVAAAGKYRGPQGNAREESQYSNCS